MADYEGDSDVVRAVSELDGSLARADAAAIHAGGAADATNDLRAMYVRAADDSDSGLIKRSEVSARSAWDLIRTSSRSLATARECIIAYAALIAPSTKLSISSKEATHPSGEQLIGPRRPRSARAVVNLIVKESDTPREGYEAARTYTQNIESFLRPPGPTGSHLVQPQPAAVDEAPFASSSGGDALQTLTLTLAVMVKAFQVSLRKLSEIVRRSSS